VQYQTPVFVRVEPDADGWGTEITKVVVVVDPDSIELARDERGQFLVYDAEFQPVARSGMGERLDGLSAAVSVAEDRHRWPEEHLVSVGEGPGWEVGPDPRDGPFYYEDDDPDAEDEWDEDGEDDDGYELVDID
jgi:hypothetical protein